MKQVIQNYKSGELKIENVPVVQSNMVLVHNRVPIVALEQYDLACRPQGVHKDWNPRYYRLLKIFERLTGVGWVLNT